MEDSRAETVQAALTICSEIERQLYPVNAKYHLQTVGLPITLRSRTQDCRLLTPTFQEEVRQMQVLVDDRKGTLLAGRRCKRLRGAAAADGAAPTAPEKGQAP